MSYKTISNFNHLGRQVDDLVAIRTKIKAAGLIPYNHGNYALERRFYFNLRNKLEIKVVSHH